MEVAIKSHVGKERPENEDSLFIDEKLGVFIVADGMGGHRAGKVASSLATESAYDYILKNFAHANEDKKGFLMLLQAAFQVAHKAIKEQALQDSSLKGMGTTLLIVILDKEQMVIGHVGDSRAYLINEGIVQLTTDQTVGEYLVAKKNIKRDEISTLSWHSLTQAVGESEEIVPEINEVKICREDMLLLCSDGLTDMLGDKEIKSIVDANRNDLKKTTNELVAAANKKGGKDNISLILAKDH